MKKIILGSMIAMTLTGVAFSQEVTLAFENKISSDIVFISKDSTEFSGITNQVTLEMESEKVNAGVSLITSFAKDDNDDFGFSSYEFDKAYVEFNPLEILSIDFNKKIFTNGSYLPIADDNIGNSNLASDISVLVKPLKNLSVGAGINLPSIFSDVDDKIDFNIGADYTTDIFSVGATLRTPLNNLGFGIFGSFTGVENLTVNLGFAYNDDFSDIAGNLLTLGATYEISIFSIGFDFVTNFGNTGNDLYSALCVETGLTDSLTIEAQAAVNMDFDDIDSTETVAELGTKYEIGNHALRAGVAVFITDTVGISFPVYYKYSF